MSANRVSILSIGTELTSGQILNRNSSWISGRLARLGIQTSGHWVVPDDRPLIRKSLEIATETSDLIFVTGGLGPTTDDFTREMIAEWAGLSLEWHQPSWEHVEQRLRERGIKVQESQRQQCYYPKGSEVLSNSGGTAHGFRLDSKGKVFVVLPGPPREIAAIWKDHLETWIPSQFPGLDPWITESWDTIGIPESSVAEWVEKALIGCDLERGYRVHLPYVEVKLSYPKSQTAQAQPWVEKVGSAIAFCTALRGGQDVAQKLGLILRQRNQNFLLIDAVGHESFFQRLLPEISELWRNGKVHLRNSAEEMSSKEALELGVKITQAGTAEAWIRIQGQKRRTWTQSPYRSSLLSEREKQYFIETAALFWVQELENEK